jgi:hypothetical protein
VQTTKERSVIKLKKYSISSLVVVTLLGMSGIALAEHEESHLGDTRFSFGYDDLNHFLAINIGSNDTADCTLEGTALPATYENGADGVYRVGLPASYDLCDVSGVVVAGPNGQINHGQFMKAAKSLLGDMQGHGCVNRYLAKSNIGKGNDPTHLAVSKVEALEFVFGGAGTIDFTAEEVDCNRGKKDEGTAATSANSGHTKGKSADAPGHNK